MNSECNLYGINFFTPYHMKHVVVDQYRKKNQIDLKPDNRKINFT